MATVKHIVEFNDRDGVKTFVEADAKQIRKHIAHLVEVGNQVWHLNGGGMEALEKGYQYVPDTKEFAKPVHAEKLIEWANNALYNLSFHEGGFRIIGRAPEGAVVRNGFAG